MSGDLRSVPQALALSKATMRNIKQNLGFAFGYNIIGIPLAAGVLYPGFGVLLNPMIAALAMALSSLSVVANSSRLRRFTPQPPATPATPSTPAPTPPSPSSRRSSSAPTSKSPAVTTTSSCG